MPTPTYTALANITLSSSASSVTFSSIPGTYRDLVYVIAGKLTINSATDTTLIVNSDSGSNYSRVYAFGNGGSATSGVNTGTAFWPWFVNITESTSIGHIMDYSATNKHKTLLSRQSAIGAPTGVSMQAQRWASTAAITSLTFGGAGNSFAAGTTFSLYGIAS